MLFKQAHYITDMVHDVHSPNYQQFLTLSPPLDFDEGSNSALSK